MHVDRIEAIHLDPTPLILHAWPALCSRH